MAQTDFTRTWWSVQHDHWGVAPTVSDHPDPAIRAAQTGWRVVQQTDCFCGDRRIDPQHKCWNGEASRISTTRRVFHAEFGWEALALMDAEFTEALR